MAQKSRKKKIQSRIIVKKNKAQLRKEFKLEVDELVNEISDMFWSDYLFDIQVRVIFMFKLRMDITFIIHKRKRLSFGKLGHQNSTPKLSKR